MAFARSLHTFNRSKKMNCKLSCKAVYTSIASKVRHGSSSKVCFWGFLINERDCLEEFWLVGLVASQEPLKWGRVLFLWISAASERSWGWRNTTDAWKSASEIFGGCRRV